MTPSERSRAFSAARNRVIRGRTTLMRMTRDDVVALLREAETAIAAVLGRQPTEYELWSLPQLQREIRQVLAEYGERAQAKAGAAIGEAAQLGAEAVTAPVEAALPEARIAAQLPRLAVPQLAAMRAFMVDRIKDIGVQAGNRIAVELGFVAIGARAPSDAISAVKRILGEASRARATTIVRTELGRAFSVATQERMDQAAKLLPGLKKQWRRSGKLHPRLEHDLIDGQIRDVDKPFTVTPFGRARVQLMFPRDPKAPPGQTINCGCDSLPYMASWEVKHPGRAPGSPLLDGGADETLAEILARQRRRPQPAPA